MPKTEICTKLRFLDPFCWCLYSKSTGSGPSFTFEAIRAALLQTFVSTNSVIIQREVNRETDATGICDVTQQNETRT